MRHIATFRDRLGEMGRPVLSLTESDRRLLGNWVRAGTTPQRVARRARIVLLSADGCSTRAIARHLGVSTHTVELWRSRFRSGGASALKRDAPGRGRKATVAADAERRVRALLATPPPGGNWTVRALATAIGISRASMHRILKSRAITSASASDDDAHPAPAVQESMPLTCEAN
jgi:transposase